MRKQSACWALCLALLCSLVLPAQTSFAATPTYGLIDYFPSTNDYSQVTGPVDLAFDTAGNKYVADARVSAILKFDASGAPLGHWLTELAPSSIAVGQDGNIYVGTFNHIDIYDPSGTLLDSFGEHGSGDGQFRSIRALAADNEYIYVLDSLNDRVQIFDRSDYSFVAKFGSAGSGNGQFHGNHPTDLAIDEDHNIYVADPYNYRIQVFEYDSTSEEWAYFSQIGTNGNSPGQFIFPSTLVVKQFDANHSDVFVYDSYQLNGTLQSLPVIDRRLSDVDPSAITQTLITGMTINLQAQLSQDPISGYLYIADHRSIVRTDDPGNMSNWIGLSADRFSSGEGIAVDAAGNYYVADTYRHRIMVYDAGGSFIRSWGSFGAGDGQFNNPKGIALNSAGQIYVADSANLRIQKFAPDGTFLAKIESNGSTVQFTGVHDIAIDSVDNIYVSSDRHVYKFAADGTYLAKWGDPAGGDGDGNFIQSRGIAIDSADHVYVTDWQYHRIQKFAADGTFLAKWGRADHASGSAPGEFNYPTWIAVDSDDRVLVVDRVGGRIQLFDPDGSYVTEFGSFPVMSQPGAIAVTASNQPAISDLSLFQVRIFQDIEHIVSPLEVTAVGGNQSAALSFAAPAGATSITVQQSVYGSGIWTEAVTANALNESSTSAVVTGLADNTTYLFTLTIVGGTYQGVTDPAQATTHAASSTPADPADPPVTPPANDDQPADQPDEPITPSEEQSDILLTDIEGHWAEEFIRQAVKEGLVQGYPNHTFQPDRHVTRAEFVSFIAQMNGWAQNNDLPLTFKDNQDIPMWAQGFIARAVKEHIISGYPDGTFRAGNTITRAEAVSIVIRLLDRPLYAGEPAKFADDGRIPAWARDYVYTAAHLNIVSGRGNNMFMPEDPITRAETVVIMLKVKALIDS